MNRHSTGETEANKYIFQLFVAGDEPHSRAAMENLRKICEDRLDGECKIEIIDVFQSFDTALKNNIFLTPALIKVSPLPRASIFGTLDDTERVLAGLGLISGDS
jgi:circadian clock protein KaiB